MQPATTSQSHLCTDPMAGCMHLNFRQKMKIIPLLSAALGCAITSCVSYEMRTFHAYDQNSRKPLAGQTLEFGYLTPVPHFPETPPSIKLDHTGSATLAVPMMAETIRINDAWSPIPKGFIARGGTIYLYSKNPHDSSESIPSGIKVEINKPNNSLLPAATSLTNSNHKLPCRAAAE